MILLKKPYTLVAFTSATKKFNVYGKSFFNITNVYLSSSSFDNTTFFNPFSSIPNLSAQYPGFEGIELSSSEYTSNNENTISFTIPPATRPGFVDIIVQNPAGYGTLTQYVIKERYTEDLSLSALRPWSPGIKIIN